MRILEYPTHDIVYASTSDDRECIREALRCIAKKDFKSEKEANDFIKRCLEQNPPHWSPIEHSRMTVKFFCDRGVSHELVRHRIASFSQESTRYCNYSKDKFGSETTVIKPVRIVKDSLEYDVWKESCLQAEDAYFKLLDLGVKPQNARAVLPTCLKTEIVVTANLREWYHIFELRDDRAAHPDMRFMMHSLLIDVAAIYPEIFQDMMLEKNKEFVKDFCQFEKKGESNV